MNAWIEFDMEGEGDTILDRQKAFVFGVELEINRIAKSTHTKAEKVRVLCSADAAVCMQMAGVLNWEFNMQESVDDDYCCGELPRGQRVFIDPTKTGIQFTTTIDN